MTSTMISAVLIGATLGAALAAQPAEARNNCSTRDKIIEKLHKSYGETRQSVGLGTNNSMMEVFASDETGTWTITVTLPTGVTCLIASGQAFENLPSEVIAEGDDA